MSIASILGTLRPRCILSLVQLVSSRDVASCATLTQSYTIDGSEKIAVLAFFLEVEAEHRTPVLDTILSHLPAIQTPGTTTRVPEVNMIPFQEHAKKLKY